MPAPLIIRMENVSYISGERPIIHDISWTVDHGQHWAIVGLNGSGKTTLLKLIMGYVFPSTGSVTVLGKTFGAHDWRELRKEIGFVSSALQERLYAGETAEEIVLSGLHGTIGLYETPSQRDGDAAAELLGELHCSHVRSQPYAELSQGEKQKVLIARALIRKPRILILDEPCAGLDLFSREQFLASVGRLAARPSAPTLLYVSHHIEEILPAFTHTLLLRRGEISAAGETVRVLTSATLSSFFESPVVAERNDGRVWVRIRNLREWV